MKMGLSGALAAAAAAAVTLTAGIPVAAHHSFSMFDGSKKIRVSGVVREFQWTNPHIWIELGVPDANGRMTNWSIEAPAVNGLARAGWNSRSLKAGDRVSVDIHPLRSGGPGGALVLVTFADGRTLGQTAIQRNRDSSGR
jgi:hypothetical protein